MNQDFGMNYESQILLVFSLELSIVIQYNYNLGFRLSPQCLLETMVTMQINNSLLLTQNGQKQNFTESLKMEAFQCDLSKTGQNPPLFKLTSLFIKLKIW